MTEAAADPPDAHEVFLELNSGSRVLVGSDLPDVPAANAVARHWREIAEGRPDDLHETLPGSGCMVRGSSIIAIKAQKQPRPTKAEMLFKVQRPGVWL